MTLHRICLIAAVAGSALAMAGCWGDSDDEVITPAPPVVVVTEVPSSASVSTAALVSFILALATNDETSEPLTIGSTFAVLADETAEPTVL